MWRLVDKLMLALLRDRMHNETQQFWGTGQSGQEDMVMQKESRISAKTPYAWVILLVLFLGLAASFGMRVSFGAYVGPWEDDFLINSRTVISSIPMLGLAFYAIAQPLVGKLNDRFGKSVVPTFSLFLFGISLLLTSRATHIWQVYLSFGLGFFFGTAGCSNVISSTVIRNWFVEKRGFAIGLVTSGMAVGQLIFVPTNLFIIERIGWRSTMAALSIIIMVVVGPLFILILRSRPDEKGMKPYGYVKSDSADENKNDERRGAVSLLPIKGIFKTRAFWLLAIPFFICGFSDVGLINSHLIPMYREMGVSTENVALSISLIAIFNIIGSIGSGHIADHFSRKRQLALIYSIRAITYIFFIIIREPWFIFLFAIAYGISEMASIAPTHSLTFSFFDKYSAGAVVGIVSVSHQVGGSIGALIPGVFYDLTGSYDSVMIFSVAILFVAVLMSMGIPESAKKT